LSRPRLSKIDLWGNLELRLLGVLFLALEMMRKTETGFPAREDSISRILVKYIRRANEKLIPQNMHVDHLPSFQSQNQPDHDLPEGNEAERKKPDFLWEWRDPNEKMDDKRYKYYAIECKRLGTPQSTFCTHYITQGVCRFINLEHSYSKHTSSGTMIGYIQSMIASDILIEVNAEARNYNIPAIELNSDGWKKKGVSRLD